jgi:hypothetical protein
VQHRKRRPHGRCSAQQPAPRKFVLTDLHL